MGRKLQWVHGRAAVVMWLSPCIENFDVIKLQCRASERCPRLLRPACIENFDVTKLQWVHGRAAVVMFAGRFKLAWEVGASMGPRPRGRGDVRLSGAAFAAALASMGPRPRGRGDASQTVPLPYAALASMGPRPR